MQKTLSSCSFLSTLNSLLSTPYLLVTNTCTSLQYLKCKLQYLECKLQYLKCKHFVLVLQHLTISHLETNANVKPTSLVNGAKWRAHSCLLRLEDPLKLSTAPVSLSLLLWLTCRLDSCCLGSFQVLTPHHQEVI